MLALVSAVTRRGGRSRPVRRPVDAERHKPDVHHPAPRSSFVRADWAPDGKSILGLAVVDDGDPTACSGYWTQEAVLADPATGARAGSSRTLQPGRRASTRRSRPTASGLADRAARHERRSELDLTTPGDLVLTQAKPPTCRRARWSGDPTPRARVVQADDCTRAAGEIVRVDVDGPAQDRVARPDGDNPSFQPLTSGRTPAVLCPTCRRQLTRAAAICGTAAPRSGAATRRSSSCSPAGRACRSSTS